MFPPDDRLPTTGDSLEPEPIRTAAARGRYLPQLGGAGRRLAVGVVANIIVWAAVTVGFTTVASVAAPTIAGAAGVCDTLQPAHISFQVAMTGTPGVATSQHSKIDAVSVTGLGPGCDGLTARIKLSGNAAGDPSTPATTLSTVSSTTDPCTQKKLTNPPTVSGGSITLRLCSTPTPATYASVHNLTQLTLLVGGNVITVTPTTSASTGSGSQAGTGTSNHSVSVATATAASSLAFTGAEITAMVGSGLSLVVGGLLILRLSRRRRSQPTGSDPPQG